jgi:sRNA-binding protein
MVEQGRPSRDEIMSQDHKQVIEVLTVCYPKAFFVNPRQRLPLKYGIEKDIKPDEVALAAGHPVDVNAAVDFYRSHVGYQISLQAGATRIDLNGNRAGTVTAGEGIEAEQRVREIHRVMAERREQQQKLQQTTTPGKVLQSMHGNNTDDQYRKIDAPPLPKPAAPPPTSKVPPSIPPPSRNDEIVRRYQAGESSPGIAKDYGLRPWAVRNIVRAAGVPIRPRGTRTVAAPPVQPTMAIPEPTSPVASIDKQLKLAIRRVDIASANVVTDREFATMTLKSAADILQAVIKNLDEVENVS